MSCLVLSVCLSVSVCVCVCVSCLSLSLTHTHTHAHTQKNSTRTVQATRYNLQTTLMTTIKHGGKEGLKQQYRAGGMPQGLRALPDLQRLGVQLPKTHMVAHNHLKSS